MPPLTQANAWFYESSWKLLKKIYYSKIKITSWLLYKHLIVVDRHSECFHRRMFTRERFETNLTVNESMAKCSSWFEINPRWSNCISRCDTSLPAKKYRRMRHAFHCGCWVRKDLWIYVLASIFFELGMCICAWYAKKYSQKWSWVQWICQKSTLRTQCV